MGVDVSAREAPAAAANASATGPAAAQDAALAPWTHIEAILNATEAAALKQKFEAVRATAAGRTNGTAPVLADGGNLTADEEGVADAPVPAAAEPLPSTVNGTAHDAMEDLAKATARLQLPHGGKTGKSGANAADAVSSGPIAAKAPEAAAAKASGPASVTAPAPAVAAVPATTPEPAESVEVADAPVRAPGPAAEPASQPAAQPAAEPAAEPVTAAEPAAEAAAAPVTAHADAFAAAPAEVIAPEAAAAEAKGLGAVRGFPTETPPAKAAVTVKPVALNYSVSGKADSSFGLVLEPLGAARANASAGGEAALEQPAETHLLGLLHEEEQQRKEARWGER